MKRSFVLPTLLWLMIAGFSAPAQVKNTMYAHYINIGQGAAVLLEFPCGAMLIDAGAQDKQYHDRLISYLSRFFKRRIDLNNTLDLVMVTHPHIDHNEALADVQRHFTIRNYIDDGMRTGSGRKNQVLLQDSASAWGIHYATYSFETITKDGNQQGLTNKFIDPINCPDGDPEIILYSGNFEAQPDDWTKTDYNNANNQSLVVKIIFGKATYLFTGDLETKGIATIVKQYAGTGALKADVLMVGHHGAANATTDEYLDAVTPSYAVISCGPWDYGKDSKSAFNTWSYGHPRISTIDMLEKHITHTRTPAIKAEAASGAKNFSVIDVDKRIYATPWDSTIVISATTAGAYTVMTGK